MTELIFEVREAQEGGFTAKALSASIHTEADTLEELKEQIRDAVKCHFGSSARDSLSVMVR